MFTHVVMLKSQVLSPWKRRKTKTMVPPVATQIMEPSVKEVDVGSTKKSAFDQSVLEIQPMLVPCPTCTRTFLPDSLKKHSLVCQKIFISKRKVFDSSKKRVEGTDLALFNQKNYLKTSPAVTKKTPEILINNRRQPTWVEPHRQLVNTAKSKKGDALTETAPKMPLAAKKSPVSSVMASHQRCEYCDRQFGPKAFDRHVEWCKERAIRIPVNPTLSMAKERLQARIQYKTPPLKAPSRAVIREKYSPGIGRTDSMRNTKTSGVATATRPKNEKPAVKTTASRGEERRKPQHKVELIKTSSSSNARESVYDPFKSAERQFEELLRCDDFISTSVTRPRPATTVLPRATVVNCLEKSAVKSAGLPNKRASVIEPPPNFQDTIGADFEFQEALLNNDVDDDFFLNVDKPLEGREMERKYSDDMSSIDSNLINENDNLSIPEFLKMGGYWSTSTEDTVKSNDNVDHYSAEYDELFAAIEPSTTKETIAGNREGPGLFKPVPKLRNKNEANNCFLDREIANNNKPRKQVESTRGSRRKPEDVIAVDNDTFQQYMMYEERYLKEKKNNSNVRNQKQHAKQISSDSAYGSLARKTSQDQAKPPEPSPLEQLEIASVEAQPTTNVIARVEARPTTNVIASVEARPTTNVIARVEAQPTTNVTVSMFCHECGTKYVLTTAKFCVVCGVRRLVL